MNTQQTSAISHHGDEPLYASIDGRAASLGGDEVAFYDPQLDRNQVMTVQVLQALDLCREFQPLEAHVQKVVTQLQGMQGKQEAVRRVLESLASRGLLISEDAFLTRLRAVAPREQAPLSGLFIRACDRPESVKRLLNSLIDQHRRHPLPAPVILVDDSVRAEASGEHRRLLSAFAAEVDHPTFYVGAEEWGAVVSAVAAEVDDAAALSPLLRRMSGHRGVRGGGIGRNLITLLAAGSRYILLDDDFVLPLHRHPEYSPGIAFSGRGWAIRTYADMSDALQAGDLESDPFTPHMQLCGQLLGPLLSDGPLALPPRALRGAAPSRLDLLSGHRRVVATAHGHRGNSGASGVAWLYLLDPSGRAGLFSNPDAFAQNVGDPAVWWACNRAQLASSGTFTPFLLDNSELMPATSPFGRGEDALFSELTGVCHGDAVHLDLPFAIGHVQAAPRDRSELIDRAETPDINHFLADRAQSLRGQLSSQSPNRRLSAFSADLLELAASSDKVLVGAMNEFLTYRRSLLIDQLKRVSANAKSVPAAWAEHVGRLITANGRAVIERGAPRFAGWSEEAGPEACAAEFRTHADVLARGLAVWPQAWEVALAKRDAWSRGQY